MISIYLIQHVVSRRISQIKKRLHLRLKNLKKSLRKLNWKISSLYFGTLLILIALFFIPVLSGKVEKTTPIAFMTQTVQDPSIELGNTETQQSGADGLKKITYSEPKSLFNVVFGGGLKNKLTEESSAIVKEPIKEVIGSGTKKYQYMYCSNGSYRYYTNAQFSNPDTGFTHKSPDYCSLNNQGTETQLANTPPPATDSNSVPDVPESTFMVPDCTTSSVPYSINYENVSWLPTGQTETYPGLDGTYFSCLGTTVQPVNEVIYVGTGQNYNVEEEELAAQLAREKCTDQYNSAMAEIDAAGAGASSAAVEVQQLYSECLDAAGSG